MRQYNALADRVELDWDAEIPNDPFASQEAIVLTIAGLLERAPAPGPWRF